MRITVGIDARKLRDFGIGRYLEGLVGGLAGLPGDDFRYVLYTPRGIAADLPPSLDGRLDPERFRLAACSAGLYSLREIVAFAGAGRRDGLSLLHFPHYVRSLAGRCPVVVTIHDDIHLRFAPSTAARLYARAMMSWSARSAAALLAVSESARDGIARSLGIAPSRFAVTPNGVSGFSRPAAEELAAFRRHRALEEPFVLCVGSHRPHKNLAGAVEAFRRLGRPGVRLVIPARGDEDAARLRPLIPGTPEYRILTPVRDGDLGLLYASAEIVLVPSLAEGFGLPGLEALACGAAVLATDLPVHREVLGDAADFAASGSAEDLARGLQLLLDAPGRRKQLAAAGPARAAAFSWERTARLTRDVYTRVAHGEALL